MKEWIKDTFSFTFIKKLILDKDDSNLKEALAWFMGISFILSSLYTIYLAKNTDERENVLWILLLGCFSLLGVDIIGKGWKRQTEHITERKIKTKDAKENEGDVN